MTAQKPRRRRTETTARIGISLSGERLPFDRFQLLVHCRNETEQRRLYHMLIAKGLMCRVLVS